MDTEIKHRIIDKILVTKDKKLLNEIEQILDSQMSDSSAVSLTEEQKWMLEMSEQDLKNDHIISQEKLNANDRTWLQEK